MPLIIAAFWAALIPMLRTWLPSLVGRVLLAFGVGLAAHYVALPPLLALILSYMDGLPDFWVQMFGALWVDVVITMVLSCAIAQRVSKAFLRVL